MPKSGMPLVWFSSWRIVTGQGGVGSVAGRRVVQPGLLDELEDHHRDEDLGDAGDAERRIRADRVCRPAPAFRRRPPRSDRRRWRPRGPSRGRRPGSPLVQHGLPGGRILPHRLGAALLAQPPAVRSSATAIAAPAILLKHVLINMLCSFSFTRCRRGPRGAHRRRTAAGRTRAGRRHQPRWGAPGHVAGVLQGGGRSRNDQTRTLWGHL